MRRNRTATLPLQFGSERFCCFGRSLPQRLDILDGCTCPTYQSQTGVGIPFEYPRVIIRASNGRGFNKCTSKHSIETRTIYLGI